MEFTLLAAAALGVAAANVMLWWEARHGNADRCAGNLWDTMLIAAAAGLFFGRLTAMVLDGVNPIVHPGDVIIVRAGVSTVGATIGAAATFLWLARREPVAMADGVAAAMLAGLAGWHTGCIFRSGCLGTVTDLPWAVAQPGSLVTRHPVELYTAGLFLIAALAIALWKAFGRPIAGLPASLAVAATAGIRLATEPMRPSLGGGPIWWYLAGFGGGLAAAAAFWWRARTRGSPRLAPPV